MSKIKKVQVFGERNSGTNFVAKLIKNNFEEVNVVAGNKGFGWKHGDLGKPFCYYKEPGQPLFCHSIQDYKKQSDDVLFIVVYRSPITWMQSMNNSPHHAPLLFGLGFSEFLRHRWTTYWGVWGHDMEADEKKRLATVKDENLVEDYENVIMLREKKIETFEGFAAKVKNVCYVQYEAVRDNTDVVLEIIADTYGLHKTGAVSEIKEDKFGTGEYVAKEYDQPSVEDLKFIQKHLNTSLEQQIGYVIDLEGLTNPIFRNLSRIGLARPFKRSIRKHVRGLVDGRQFTKRVGGV